MEQSLESLRSALVNLCPPFHCNTMLPYRFGRSANKQPAQNTFQEESMDSGAFNLIVEKITA